MDIKRGEAKREIKKEKKEGKSERKRRREREREKDLCCGVFGYYLMCHAHHKTTQAGARSDHCK